MNMKVNRESLQVLASQTCLVLGLIFLDLGSVLVNNDLTILEVELVVLDSCLQLNKSGTIGDHTVFHGVNDIAPDSLREVVTVGLVHGIGNLSGLNGQFKRRPNHYVLIRACSICEGVIREGEEQGLV